MGHDNTQLQPWYNPFATDCMRSVKSPHPNDPRNYKDLFSLNFGPGGGSNAVCDLEFNITGRPGVFQGHWFGKRRPDLHDIPNTLVDVGVAPNGTYTWTLEFQCADAPDTCIHFAAVNFYHRNPLVPKAEFDDMLARFKARGLGWLVEATKEGLTMVNQEKCVQHQSYPARDAPTHWCGQGPDSSLVV